MSQEQTLEEFIEEWADTPERNRAAFIHLRDYLAAKDGVKFEFIPRAGLTYSLRAAHKDQTKKAMFVMIDVIEDDPRWLSMCSYAEMFKDPDELGDFVPEGLLGEDAMCFDIEEWDDKLIAYLEARLDEAYETALKG